MDISNQQDIIIGQNYPIFIKLDPNDEQFNWSDNIYISATNESNADTSIYSSVTIYNSRGFVISETITNLIVDKEKGTLGFIWDTTNFTADSYLIVFNIIVNYNGTLMSFTYSLRKSLSVSLTL